MAECQHPGALYCDIRDGQKNGGVPPPKVLPQMRDCWSRASAAANLHTHEDTYSALMRGRKGKGPAGWRSRYAPYLLSASANKQWTQSRVASTRHPDWATTDLCQLCNSAKGTLPHRHECPCVLASVGPEVRYAEVAFEEVGMDPLKKELWRTRGIGAFRVHRHQRSSDETLVWLRQLAQHEDEGQLTWFVDASQIDDDFDATRTFGFGLIAVTPSGRLAAAARGNPPGYVATIAQAEAHAVTIALEATTSRAAIFRTASATPSL